MTQRELLAGGGCPIDVLVDGAGPALVLLPSSQRDSLDFDRLANALAAHRFKVLRPQPRGMQRSGAALPGLSLADLAHDVARVTAAFGEGRAIVAGHAFGHYVARVADLEHPARVRGVVAIAAAARVFPPGLAQALDTAADAARPTAERLAALQHAFFAPGNDAGAWLDGWHPDLREVYRAAAAVPPKDAWWPVSHAPLLDLQAACDPWRPPATRDELRRVLPHQVSVMLIGQASHALPVEQPQAVADAIAAWARGLPP